ncbi:MAG: hypothetical protein JWN70_3874 [Planctomycetaceae bacterium]|nr:hypothetical protein [Planctomycetaceae bacterium]
MPSLDDVQFDTTDWEPRPESAEHRRTWVNAWGDVLSIRFNAAAPQMPSLFRLQALKDFHTQQLQASGGTILSLDLLQVKGVSVGKLLFKTMQPEGGWGYVSMLFLPYRDFSYSIRIQTLERAGDEGRGQHVWEWLHQSHPQEADRHALWFGLEEAPADPHIARHCMADEDRWDAQFPDHPLSRLRAELGRVIPTLVVSRDVKNSAPHRG